MPSPEMKMARWMAKKQIENLRAENAALREVVEKLEALARWLARECIEDMETANQYAARFSEAMAAPVLQRKHATGTSGEGEG